MASQYTDLQYPTQRVESYNSMDKTGMGMDPFTTPRRQRPVVIQVITKTYRRFMRGWVARLIYVGLGVVLMIIWVGVILGFASTSKKLEQENALNDVQGKVDGVSFGLGGGVDGLIFMKANLKGFDPDSGSLGVQWSVVLAHPGNETVPFEPWTADNGNNLTLGMEFWVDMVAVFDQDLTNTINDGGNYLSMENRTVPPRAILGLHAWDSVDTDVDMDASVEDNIWKQPLFGYPWDEYSGQIQVALSNAAASSLLSQQGSNLRGPGLFAFYPDGVTVGGNVLNWNISTTNEVGPVCQKTTLFRDAECALSITFNAKRTISVRFIVIAVVIVNWLTTLVIFLLTGESVLLRRTHILEGTDMLGVCFAALFALPTVRSLLPGAPVQFGAVIDLIGIVPNVIIISLCTLTFAIARLRIRAQQKEIEDEKARMA